MINLTNRKCPDVTGLDILKPIDINSTGLPGQVGFHENLLVSWDDDINRWLSVSEDYITFTSSNVTTGDMSYNGIVTDILFGVDVSDKDIILSKFTLNRVPTIPSGEIEFDILRNNVIVSNILFQPSDLYKSVSLDNLIFQDNGSIRIIQKSALIQPKVVTSISYRVAV